MTIRSIKIKMSSKITTISKINIKKQLYSSKAIRSNSKKRNINN